jgi:peptide/nickel transport system permease protein
LALILLFVVLILVAVVPLLPGYDPFSQNLASSLLTPGEASIEGQLYLLGSDALGGTS